MPRIPSASSSDRAEVGLKSAVALTAVACLAGAVWVQVHRLRASRPQVWSEAVTERDVTATVTGIGRVVWRRQTVLSSPGDGRVRAVLVDRGAPVRVGQALVVLDDQPLRLALEHARGAAVIAAADVRRAQADVDRVQAELELARLDERRSELLVTAGVEAPEVLVRRRHDVHVAELAYAAAFEAVKGAGVHLRSAEADTLDAQARLLGHVVRAPANGVVAEVLTRRWQPVHGGSTHVPPSRLLTLATPDITDVDVSMDAGDSARLRHQGRVWVAIPSLGVQGLQGRVVAIDAASVRVRLDASLRSLRAGMSATVRFTAASRPHALAVPNHAVAAGGGTGVGRGGVWTVRDGVIALVPIVLGLRGDFYSEVLAGLSPGTLVVTGPAAVVATLGLGDRAVAVPAPIRAP